ncbi:MAG TPA: cell division protein FtsA [Gemmatimonadales bacterium]|jgi:cell division protein FtsA
MKRGALIAGLDLGSTKTCAVIGEVRAETGDLRVRVLGVGTARATGVKRGLVRDIEETTQSVVRAIRDAERMAGVKVSAVFCGIAGDHVRTQMSTGLASVTGDEIRRQDTDRVDDVARAVSLGDGYELLHSIPQEYKVDSQRGISDPVGMTGLRLEVEMCLIATQAQAAQNLRKAVQRGGYGVGELVLEPLAGALAVLTDEERELGCALVDLGGGSTTVAVFHDGKLRHLASLPYAGSHVTNDLVQGLGVTQADAERLKERWGVAYNTENVNPEELVELPAPPGHQARQAKRELLTHIIQERLDEIFGLVLEHVEAAGYVGRLPSGIILTGGGAQLTNIVELGREVFAMPVRTGVPGRGITGLVDSVQEPRFAVPVGLVLYGARRRAHGELFGGTGAGRWVAPVKRWLQDFF